MAKTIKVRGLFRLEWSDNFEEFLRCVEENSLEAKLDTWEAEARRVLRAAGLPDHLRGVILEPGGGWRESDLGPDPTDEDVDQFRKVRYALGERIVRLDDLIEVRQAELGMEYRAAKVLFHAWLLRQALASGDARDAAANALRLQQHVDYWMATRHWERPVEKHSRLRLGGREKGPREETQARDAWIAARVRQLAMVEKNRSTIARKVAAERGMKKSTVLSIMYRKKLLH